MINIAICDDEKVVTEYIKNMINEICPLEKLLIKTYESGQKLSEAFSSYGVFNIIFMDIEIGDCNGVELIESIRKIDSDVIVIFITNYPNYVSGAFRVGAFQYLQKPININEFTKDFYRAINQLKKLHTKYRYKNNGTVYFLKLSEIYAVEVYNKKIKIHTINKIIEEDHRDTIKNKTEQLTPYGFAQCHKSYLVNLHKVSNILKDTVLLLNGNSIPLSRNYRNSLLQTFNFFIARYSI